MVGAADSRCKQDQPLEPSITAKPRRGSDEIIVLSLCGLCMMGLALFTFIRFQRGDLAVAAVDALGFVVSSLIFTHVFRTGDLKFAGPALAMLSLGGAVALVFLAGPEERYLVYPTTVVSFFLMRPRWALSASIAALVLVSIVVLPAMDVFGYGKFLLSVSGCFLFAYIFARQRNQQRDELVNLTTQDPLTGVGNRRAFEEQLDELARVQARTHDTISLLLLDLDRFKTVNDTYGHDRGDEVLRRVAGLIEDRMRAGDHVFRLGGDEFAVLARGQGVQTLAADLCDKVVNLAESMALPFSVSVGVAEKSADHDIRTWIRRADEALYAAKTAGRNRVSLASNPG